MSYDIDDRIGVILKEVQIIEGYTARQLSDKLYIPWTTVKWHLKRMEESGLITHVEVGRAKVYRLVQTEEEGNDLP